MDKQEKEENIRNLEGMLSDDTIFNYLHPYEVTTLKDVIIYLKEEGDKGD